MNDPSARSEPGVAQPDPTTLCARSEPVPPSASRPLVPPIELSSVYCIADLEQIDLISDGGLSGYIYARDGHPNASQLAAKLSALEHGESGLVCASGMGAIASVMLSLLSQNDHLLVSDGIYGKTTALVTRQLARWGIAYDVFDPSDATAIERLRKPHTRLIFAETITNPLLRVADLAGLGKAARAAGIPLAIDNTFAPLICRPLDHGASLVVHSVTKMLGGHGDLTLGAVVGDSQLVEQAAVVASTLGQTGNPFESWLALRGIATLGLRFPRACATSLDLARRLEGNPTIKRVYYPGLESHSDFALGRQILEGGSGTIVTIDLGTRAKADRFVRAIASTIPFAPSLGDVQTTLSHPVTTSHRAQSETERLRQGITPGTIRLSIGLESPEDLWREFRSALEAVSRE